MWMQKNSNIETKQDSYPEENIKDKFIDLIWYI